MADDRYTSETFVRVYDNRHGTYYEVSPDADGLGLITLSCVEPGASRESFPKLVFDREVIPEIINALSRVAHLNGDYHD